MIRAKVQVCVLVSAEVNYFTVAGMGLCFRFVVKQC